MSVLPGVTGVVYSGLYISMMEGFVVFLDLGVHMCPEMDGWDLCLQV